MTILCAFTQHDRRVHLVQAHLVHFFNPPCCRPDSCGCDSHVTCAVAKMRRDYSFVSDVETLDVKRQLYGWIQLILVYLLNPLSVSPCAIIEHRAWFALIEPKMSVIKLIRLFDKSIPSADAHSVAPISSSVHLLVWGGELLHLWTTVWHGVHDCNWRQRLLFISIMGGTSLVIVDADLSS